MHNEAAINLHVRSGNSGAPGSQYTESGPWSVSPTLTPISVALENSVEEVSCPDNINSVYCLLSGHETLSTEFSNATEIHCTPLA